MRVLHAKQVTEAPPGWRARVEASGRPVVIDVGSGDGRYAYECARVDPGTLYVAVDPDAETLTEYAFRASRKPARGGVPNVEFVVASVEALPPELQGLANRVRVNFPWGSLMRGLLEPQTIILDALARLLRPEGSIELVMSYDSTHDLQAFAGESLPSLDDSYFEHTLLPGYEAAGFRVVEHGRMTRDEALELPSTWGRRLLHSRPREVYRLTMMPTHAR